MDDLLRTLRLSIEQRPPIDVAADLDVEVGGHVIHVESYTDRLVVELPSAAAAWGVYRAAPEGAGSERLRELVETAAAAGLGVDIRLGGRSVARAGADVTPGAVARLLGLGPVRLAPGGLVLGLLD